MQAPRTDQAEAYATAIDHLCDRDMTSKALSLGSSMIEALAGASETQAAMELGFRVTVAEFFQVAPRLVACRSPIQIQVAPLDPRV